MPYLMPSAAMLIIWLILFDYGGPINRLVAALGFDRVFWLEGAALRVPIVLLYIWKNLGFSVVIFNTPRCRPCRSPCNEYASLEGAGWFRREWSITLPQILPTAFLVFVLAVVNAFKIFKEVYFIGGAYPAESIYTLQHYMNNKFAKLDYQDVTTAAYSFAVIVNRPVLVALPHQEACGRAKPPEERSVFHGAEPRIHCRGREAAQAKRAQADAALCAGPGP